MVCPCGTPFDENYGDCSGTSKVPRLEKHPGVGCNRACVPKIKYLVNQIRIDMSLSINVIKKSRAHQELAEGMYRSRDCTGCQIHIIGASRRVLFQGFSAFASSEDMVEPTSDRTERSYSI